MPTINPETASQPEAKKAGSADPKDTLFKPILVEETSVFSSLWNAFKERGRSPKMTVAYNQGASSLPISDSNSLLRDLIDSIKSLWEKPAPPSIPITSKPIEVDDIWKDYKPQRISWLNGFLVNIFIIAAILLAAMKFAPVHFLKQDQLVPVDIALSMPAALKKAGGGGGQRDKAPATKGAPPKFAMTQLAPPVAKITIPKPKLPVDATLLGPPKIKIQMADNIWGSLNGVPGPPSMGDGSGTGIGNGHGGGLGNGQTGGFGGGAFQVGGDVSQPEPIYAPDPPYTEQAREAKYQGDVVLEIVVQADGSVTGVRVVKPAGLGLDQSAEKTIRTWKFKPGTRSGVPVPVRMLVDVTFRLL